MLVKVCHLGWTHHMQSDLDNLTTPVAGEIWLDIESAGLLKHIQILIYGDLPARTNWISKVRVTKV